jgi:ABC-type multidrug transport system ATPase subunit
MSLTFASKSTELIKTIKLEIGKIFSILCENQENCLNIFNELKKFYRSSNNIFFFNNVFSFEPNFSIKDIIKFLALTYEVKEESDYYQILGKRIELNKKYKDLSSAEKILLSLFCLLITDYEYYILNLAELNIENEIWYVLQKFKEKNKGCLIISNNPSSIEKISDHVYITFELKLIDQGTPSDLVNKYVPKIFVEIFHSSPSKINEFIEALSRKRGINVISYDDKEIKLEVEKVQDSLRRIFFSAEQTDFLITNISLFFPTLNEVYKVIKNEKIWET